MENYYKRIEIKTQADLPKEVGNYHVDLKNGHARLLHFDDKGVGCNCIRIDWMNEVDAYLQPCNEKIEALEELCAKQKELIMFYGKNIGDKAVYLSIHGISDSDEDIKKGEELRQKISELESKLKGV
jgi:hypothetical protein